VGAGQPPTREGDRQREEISTFGSRVDLQGWGSGVVTTGYGDFYQSPDVPANPDFWYTGAFSGTSSAAAIVAGAVVNLQGIAFDRSGIPLPPLQIRTLLIQTGSSQLGNIAESIGPRPNLRKAIAQLTHGAIDVALDIHPGGFPNPINPRSKGVIPVSILTTETFRASAVNLTTVRFGATGTEAAPAQSALEDVDGDGDIDMMLHFKTKDTAIQCGETSASLTGQTVDGRAIEGSDSIMTVGCNHS
jgi:hypothetical protein